MEKVNIFLVEDDINFRNAFSSLINQQRSKFVVSATAVNGKEAIKILQEKHTTFDIIITDINMPILNGIELIKVVASNYPNLPIVCLSAFDEFEYVKDALKLGASDYILKNDILPENIESILSEMWEEINKHNFGPSIETLVSEYITSPNQKTITELSRILNLDPSFNNSLIWIKNETNFPADDLLTFLKEHSNEAMKCYILRREIPTLLLFQTPAVSGFNENNFKNVMDKFIEENKLSIKTIFISELFSTSKSLAKKLTNLQLIYEYTLIDSGAELVTEKTLKELALKRTKSYSFVTDQDIKFQLSQFPLSLIIENMMSAYKKQFPTIEQINKDILSIVNVLSNLYNQEIPFNDQIKFYEKVSQSETLESKFADLKTFSNMIMSKTRIYVGNNREVMNAIDYIDNHYYTDVSLATISDYVGLSENYLSNLFKQETGMNIKSYINIVRIEAAKKIMQTTNMKAYEISEQVGFKNATYFSTVFKTVTGYSLSDYKNNPALANKEQ